MNRLDEIRELSKAIPVKIDAESKLCASGKPVYYGVDAGIESAWARVVYEGGNPAPLVLGRSPRALGAWLLHDLAADGASQVFLGLEAPTWVPLGPTGRANRGPRFAWENVAVPGRWNNEYPPPYQWYQPVAASATVCGVASLKAATAALVIRPSDFELWGVARPSKRLVLYESFLAGNKKKRNHYKIPVPRPGPKSLIQRAFHATATHPAKQWGQKEISQDIWDAYCTAVAAFVEFSRTSLPLGHPLAGRTVLSLPPMGQCLTSWWSVIFAHLRALRGINNPSRVLTFA